MPRTDRLLRRVGLELGDAEGHRAQGASAVVSPSETRSSTRRGATARRARTTPLAPGVQAHVFLERGQVDEPRRERLIERNDRVAQRQARGQVEAGSEWGGHRQTGAPHDLVRIELSATGYGLHPLGDNARERDDDLGPARQGDVDVVQASGGDSGEGRSRRQSADDRGEADGVGRLGSLPSVPALTDASPRRSLELPARDAEGLGFRNREGTSPQPREPGIASA